MAFSAKTKQKRDEYHQKLVDAFLNVLEDDKLDWEKMWHGIAVDKPYNAQSGRRYRGCNQFMLSLIAYFNNYNDLRWCTFNQIKKNGWSVKAGSHGATVEYWFCFDRINKKNVTWEERDNLVKNGRDPDEFTAYPTYMTVFNGAQINGIPELKIEEHKGVEASEVIDSLSNNMKIEILNDGGDRAYYSPRQDKIHLPKMEHFEDSYAYNATALHELAHSTGHKSRLDRQLSGFFGSDSYAMEELVAEMASAFVSANLDGIKCSQDHIDNHKAYIQNWASQLRKTPNILNIALGTAEGVADYMLWKGDLIDKNEYTKRNSDRKMISAQEKLKQITEKDDQNTGMNITM